MELTTTEALKFDACVHRIAQWLQTAIEPYSQEYSLTNLGELFEKHLKDLFKERTKFSFGRASIPENSDEEFKLFVEKIELPIMWFPIFEIHVNLQLNTLVHLFSGEEKRNESLYTIAQFESEKN